MKVIEKISAFVGRFMALIVLAVAGLALFVPPSSLWIDTSWVNYLLMIVMFGMGLTMKPRDFALVFTRPRDIFTGRLCQKFSTKICRFRNPLIFIGYQMS